VTSLQMDLRNEVFHVKNWSHSFSYSRCRVSTFNGQFICVIQYVPIDDCISSFFYMSALRDQKIRLEIYIDIDKNLLGLLSANPPGLKRVTRFWAKIENVQKIYTIVYWWIRVKIFLRGSGWVNFLLLGSGCPSLVWV